MSTDNSPSRPGSKPLDRVTADLRFAMIPEDLLYSDISDGALRLFAVLHRHADRGGESYPRRTRLAKFCRCSVDTIDRRLVELKAAGWVDVEARHDEGGQRSNLYQVRLGGGTDAAGSPSTDAAGAGRDSAAHNESPSEREPVERDATMSLAAAPGPDFEAFWSAYPKRAGAKVGKAVAAREWAKLKPEEREGALAGLAGYTKAARGYPQDAERYLKHRRWVGLEVETVEDRDARVIAGAESLAEFFNVKGA